MPDDQIVNIDAATATSSEPADTGQSAPTESTTDTGADTGVTPVTKAAAPPADDAKAEPAAKTDDDSEEADPAAPDADVEGLKTSLRALAAERSRLKSELAEAQAKFTQLQSPAAPAAPETTTGEPQPYVHPQNAYFDAGIASRNPALSGKPFDATDATVYMGNPADLADGSIGNERKWFTVEDAAKIARADQIEAQLSEVAAQTQQQEQIQAARAVQQHFETAVSDMLAKSLPGLTPELTKEAESFVQAITAYKLGQEGFTEQNLLEMDDKFIARGAEAIGESVTQFRNLIAALSRTVTTTQTEAAETAPVPASGNPAVPQDKRTEEMTPTEHRNYLAQTWNAFTKTFKQ